jgi:hypothetical protein
MKKKKTTKRRRASFGKAVQKARRRRKTATGLSEIFSPATAAAAGKGILSGAVGGAAAQLILDNLLATQGKGMRVGVIAAAAFVTGAVLKYPNMAAGMGAVMAAEFVKKASPALSEEAFSEYEDLQEMPLYLDEAGNELYLAEDNSMMESDLYGMNYAPTYAQ